MIFYISDVSIGIFYKFITIVFFEIKPVSVHFYKKGLLFRHLGRKTWGAGYLFPRIYATAYVNIFNEKSSIPPRTKGSRLPYGFFIGKTIALLSKLSKFCWREPPQGGRTMTASAGASSLILEFFIKNFGNVRISLDKKTTVDYHVRIGVYV
jgi:hypothetical protein